jgi:hypothetical protein
VFIRAGRLSSSNHGQVGSCRIGPSPGTGCAAGIQRPFKLDAGMARFLAPIF